MSTNANATSARPEKPRIKKVDWFWEDKATGRIERYWLCCAGRYAGSGKTPLAAYENWKAKREQSWLTTYYIGALGWN